MRGIGNLNFSNGRKGWIIEYRERERETVIIPLNGKRKEKGGEKIRFTSS